MTTHIKEEHHQPRQQRRRQRQRQQQRQRQRQQQQQQRQLPVIKLIKEAAIFFAKWSEI